MTQVRIYSVNGFTLTYDTDDVENIEVNEQNHVRDATPPFATAVHRELTGYTTLHLHINFKHGKRALWIADEELASE